MADQVVALISSEHAEKLIWDTFDGEKEEEDSLDLDDDIEFEVRKTVEQEEISS